jgi:tRNA threonylcarbamoyladenosine biosynthesis protein TsaB
MLVAKSPAEAKIIESGSFSELLARHRVFFVGNGAEKCKQVINHPNAFFLDGMEPLATVLGTLAEKKFQMSKFEDLSLFEPFYLKQFEAKKAKSLLQ